MSAVAVSKNRGDQDNWIVGSMLWIMGKHIRIILCRCGFLDGKLSVMHALLRCNDQPMKNLRTLLIMLPMCMFFGFVLVSPRF
jgi:hypothetical protein